MLRETSSLVPFTLCFVEKIDNGMYDEAIRASQTLKQSYDPATQTSNIALQDGTSLTYRDTDTGLFHLRDDSEECDS